MKHYKITILFNASDTWHTEFYGYNIFDGMRQSGLNGYIKCWIKAHPQKCKIETIG